MIGRNDKPLLVILIIALVLLLIILVSIKYCNHRRAYDMWIHKQLGPTDIIITGIEKRCGRLKRRWFCQPIRITSTEAEIERDEDQFLAAHGVNIKPKQHL